MSELVACPHCGQQFNSITSRHKAVCAGWPKGPEVPPCLCGHVSTSLTQMKRHRADCDVWKARPRKEVAQERRRQTTLERYGVEHVAQVAEVREKTAATNLERYGAASVSSRDSIIFEKIQGSLRGRRFRFAKGSARNPFAQCEIQERIRQARLERCGVEYSVQLPDHQEKARQTSRERYGTDNPMQSAQVQAKARQTNLERYGHENPAASEEVKAKIAATNLERYGVKSTAAIPEFRKKQYETMEANWGGHFFASPQGKHKIRAGMRAKYGVDHHAQIPGFWERQVKRFVEKYGVSHPLHLAEFLEKRFKTYQRLYGVNHPMQDPEVLAKKVQTCMARYGSEHASKHPRIKEKIIRFCLAKVGKTFPEYPAPAQSDSDLVARYGVDHPMKDADYALFFLHKMGETSRTGPNGFEAKILKMAWGKLCFTGDRRYWRYLPLLGRHKNPDFVVPGPDPKKPFQDVTKVLECHGTYWHSSRFTGISDQEHERLLVEAYRDVGLECLVIWEHDLKTDPDATQRRILDFLSS